jgi:squalene-associated FAD-dependent desaturase
VDRVEDRAQQLTAAHAPIPVIGGGWAGCAAALALADAGYRVALYEAAGTLGGRARRVVCDGLPIDNGQHLILGAYTETRRGIATAHDGRPPLSRQRLALVPFAPAQSNALTLRARRLPPPFHLLLALLLAQGLAFADRLATVRWFARLIRNDYRCPPDATVAELLSGLPARVRELLWAPLCVSALNTPPVEASAQVFANVLRATFDGGAGASDVLAPGADLSELFPDAVSRWLVARGHQVHVRTDVAIARIGMRVITLTAGNVEIHADAAIVAVGPHQLARGFTAELHASDANIARVIAQVDKFAWEPIVTVYLGYAGAIDMPSGLVRLDDAPGQWVFDRRDVLARAAANAPSLAGLLAVVISAGGVHEALDQNALVAAVDAQLRRLRPALPRLVWAQVITEKRATYACTPTAVRPSAGRLTDGIYLAGDYTDCEYPATLEAAVRSGRAAAIQLVGDLPR